MALHPLYVKRFLIKFSFLFLLISGLSTLINAQPNFRIVNWTVNEGLSDGSVHKMLRDSKGFLWIATDNGLNRFDGTSFKHYVHGKLAGGKGFKGSEALGIIEDSLNNLWIGTEEGLNRYTPTLDSFHHFPTPRLNKNMTSYCMPIAATDNDIIAWEITGNIVAYNIFSLKRRVIIAGISWPKETYYLLNNSAFDEISKTVWFPYGSKILQLQLNNLHIDFLEMPEIKIQTLLFADTNLLIGTENGLIAYNLNSNMQERLTWATKISNIEILSLQKNRDGNIWIGTENNGLFLYNISKNKLFNYTRTETGINSISSNNISNIYCDKEGITWANAGDKAIDQIFPFEQAIVYYNSKTLPLLNNTGVRCFAEDAQKKIWIGTMGAGIIIFDAKTKTFKPLNVINYKNLNKAFIRNLKFNDNKSQLLIGTNTVLFKLDVVTNKLSEINFEDSEGQRIKQNPLIQHIIIFDNSSWLIATSKGVFTLNVTAEIARQVKQLKENIFFIGKFKNRYSFSLWDYDPVMYNYKEGEWKTEVFPFDDITVGCIVYDEHKNVFWVGTDQGLIMTDSTFKRLKHFTPADGLPDNFVWGLLKDYYGNLWVTTNKGIAYINKKDNRIRSFTLSDGIHGLAYNPHAYLAASDKTIYLGGKEGFDHINPAFLNNHLSPATVHIASVKINNKEINKEEATDNLRQLTLTHKQNSIELAVGVIDFYSKGHSQIRYKLLPVDNEWQEEKAPHQFRYAGLPPGKYNLQITASDSRKNWDGAIHEIGIIILPPFWQRWWFITLIVATLILIVYQVYHFRIKQLKNLLYVRTKISQDLHDEVGATLSGIAMYSHLTRTQIKSNQTVEVEKSLDIMEQSASEMVDKLNDIVWVVNPRHDSLLKLIEKLEEYATEMTSVKNIQLITSKSEHIYDMKLPMEDRRNIFLLCKEAINNVVKYSNARLLQFSINSFDKVVEFKITDDGKGFDLKNIKSGNGFINMKERAKEMHAYLNIHSEENKGTTVSLHYKIT